jgi:hypothetical protein
MYSLGLDLRQQLPECAFLDRLPRAIRERIYGLLVGTFPQKIAEYSALSFVSRQVREEFLILWHMIFWPTRDYVAAWAAQTMTERIHASTRIITIPHLRAVQSKLAQRLFQD